MSTRCQLRFTGKRTDRVAQVYRHSDGYPESVVPLLEHLQELLRATGTQRDASYAAAQAILVDSLRYMERTFSCQDGVYSDLPDSIAGVLDPESWEDLRLTPSYLLGHGVEDPSCGIRGDEEYLYVAKIPSARPLKDPGDWQIKISEHCGFPRWDAEKKDQAFEVADWQFEGILAEAVKKWGNEV
jgi:hypothetical protein